VSPDPATLVIRFGSLGDVILSFGVARDLKRRYPDDALVYLVKEHFGDLVAAQPWADEVIRLGDADRGVAGAVRLWRSLRRRRWSRLLDLQDSPRSRFVSWGLGSRTVRWHPSRSQRRRHLDRRSGAGHPGPEIEPVWVRYARAASRLGVESTEPPAVHWDETAEAEAQAAWSRLAPSEASTVIAIAPAAAWPTKEWPENHVLDLSRRLRQRGWGVLLVSTGAERDRLGELARWAAAEPGVLWFTDRLLVIAALLSRCRAAVAPDSALMHLAAATGAPVVALFGSTSPAFGFAPAGENHRVLFRDLECQPCALHGRLRCPLDHLDCLRQIGPAEVEQNLEEVLAAASPGGIDPVP
jgi:ADP-heptose:LPS heptosyltransferase